MNAYLPRDGSVMAMLAAMFAGEVVLGWLLNRGKAGRAGFRIVAWFVAISATLIAHDLTLAEPFGVRMLAIVLALLYGMKMVVGVETSAGLSPLRWLGFALLWFGMRPAIFVRAGSPSLSDARGLAIRGVVRMGIGVMLIAMSRLIWVSRETFGTETTRWLATPPLLVGLSLTFHFGLFNILAGMWRGLGVDCRPLFRAPVLSTSLNEFWSRRWNLAFSEMTALAIFRPVSSVYGRRAALAIAFAVSGVLHEVAISLPVLAGFGWPSLYFLLHGTLVLVENWLERRGTPINALPTVGRAWTLTWLLLPMPMLFHRPFLAGVVWPIVGIEESAFAIGDAS